MSNKQLRGAGWKVAALAFGSAALIAACSSASTSSSPSATPTSSMPAATSPSVSAAACKHVDSLRGSLTSLTHVQLNASSASQIRTDVTNINTQLTALKDEPGFSAQASQLRSSVDQVTNAAKKMSSPPTSAQVQAVITALSQLKAKSSGMIAGMKAACP
ncbi:MAG TPA: hypothetical protein VLX31_10870 [Streptosporangiaceae bacterium]|nr:hypothetical protein [Streptosporangiaceae bacterium]